jgi:hypothetical protein
LNDPPYKRKALVTVNDNHSANERPAPPTGPPAAETENERRPPAEEAAGGEDGGTQGDETSPVRKEPADRDSDDEDILPYWLYPD